MRVMKPLRLGLLTRTMPHKGKGLFVVSTFTLFDLLDPTDILAETAMWPLVAQELPEGTVFDAAYPKPFGEFLIAGRAMSQDPVKAMHVAVTVGETSRMLSVFGDRLCELSLEGHLFSDPHPFTEMPLTPDRAFGGEGHTANPLGHGYLSSDDHKTGVQVQLPNVELAGAELREIDDRPQPALVGPMAMDDPARIALAGTYDKAWVAHQMPDWPEDFDPRYFMSAAREQQIKGFFSGTEQIRVVGMSSARPDVSSRLPGVRARTFVNRASAPERLTEIPMHTDTVWILGSEMKGVVVNRGVLVVDDKDGRDISDIMVGYEWLKDAPRPAAYYQSVYTLRADPEEGVKYLLADGQLSPEEAPEDKERREEARLAAAMDRQEQWVEARQWRLERQFAEQGVPAELVPAVELPDIKPFVLPTEEDIARGDVDFARLISDAEDLRREAELKADMAVAELTGLVGQLGLSAPVAPPASLGEMEALGHSVSTGKGYLPAFEKLVPQEEMDDLLARFEGAPTPDVNQLTEKDPEAAFQSAKLRFEESAATGLMAPALEMVGRLPENPLAGRAIPDLPQAGTDGDRDAGSTGDAAASTPQDDLEEFLAETFPGLSGKGGSPSENLKTAITSVKPVDLPVDTPGAAVAEQLDRTQESVENALATSRWMAAEPIAPLEPLGQEAAERFGQYVRDHVAAGGSLMARDLAGALLAEISLPAADLSGSFLERCELDRADLRSAQCQDAVFAGASLSEADLSGAMLAATNLSAAAAARASFCNARLEDCKVLTADFTGCDFSGTAFSGCTFVNCTFTAARLTGAAFDNCSFVNCNLADIHAEQVHLEKTSFLSCAFDRADFSGAMMKKASFANVNFHGVKLCHSLLDDCGWFGQTDMDGVNFMEAHVSKCGFQDARMRAAGFFKAIFTGCNMSGTDLKLADMRLSSWNGSLFVFSKLHKADFFGADLLGASFHGADLTEASLRAANFFRTDLSETRLAFADLSESNLELTNMEARL